MPLDLEVFIPEEYVQKRRVERSKTTNVIDDKAKAVDQGRRRRQFHGFRKTQQEDETFRAGQLTKKRAPFYIWEENNGGPAAPAGGMVVFSGGIDHYQDNSVHAWFSA